MIEIDRPIEQQSELLIEIVNHNPNVKAILNSNPFPQYSNWYLGAGCICQSVWNYFSGKEMTHGINDYDLIYYNAIDLSKKSETKEQERINKLFPHLTVKIEITNEARVHLWFEEDFGKKIEPLKSCEDAINGWPTTATAIGVNKIDGKTQVYAPYGLHDLFSMIVRPNKPSVIKAVYEKKVEKWTKKWPELKVIPWEQI